MEHQRWHKWDIEMGARSLTIEKEAAELLRDAARRQNTSLGDVLTRLTIAVFADLENAKAMCGGDGKGCEAFRAYYDSDERRYQKCGQCFMEALSNTRGVIDGEVRDPTGKDLECERRGANG